MHAYIHMYLCMHFVYLLVHIGVADAVSMAETAMSVLLITYCTNSFDPRGIMRSMYSYTCLHIYMYDVLHELVRPARNNEINVLR
jgi:hypothetical protein